MEELLSTEALDREILEDARKKALRILKNAGETAAAVKTEWEQKLEKVIKEARQDCAKRTERARGEIMARLPMDKRRIRSEKIDGFLNAAMKRFLGSLDNGGIFLLLEGELLRRIREIGPGEKEARVFSRGLEDAEVSALLKKALPGVSFRAGEVLQGGSFPALRIDFNRLRINISVEAAAEALLLDKRAELAEALLKEAARE